MALDSYNLRKVEENKTRFPVGATCFIQSSNGNLTEAVVAAHLKQTIKVVHQNYARQDVVRDFKAWNVEEVGTGHSRIYGGPRLITATAAEDAKASEAVRMIERSMREFANVVAERLRKTEISNQAEALRTLAVEFDVIKSDLAAAEIKREEAKAAYLASK